MKKTVEPTPKHFKTRDGGDSKATYQPETSHKKAISIYGGGSVSKKTTTSSSAISKKPPMVSATKATTTKTSNSNHHVMDTANDFDRKLLNQLPQEVVLEILDYYVGFGFKACLKDARIKADREKVDLSTLKFNASMFYRQYFGKFKGRGSDTLPKLIFKWGVSTLVDDLRPPGEFHHLLSIMTGIGLPIDGYFRMLCPLHISERRKMPTDLAVREAKQLAYMTKVFKKDKALCKKITKVDLNGLETFEGAVEFAADHFPNVEILKLSHEPKFLAKYKFQRDFEISDALKSICKMSNLKDFEYVGYNFNFAWIEEISKSTPKMERVSIPSSEETIVKCGSSIGNWKNLQELQSTSYAEENGSPQQQTDFLTALNELPIKKLVLHYEKIAESKFNSLPSSITFLELKYSRISSQLFESISGLLSLQTLNLDYASGFDKEDFKHLRNLTNLEELSLKQSACCGDVGAKHISMIESLKRVDLSNLDQDKLTDEGGVALSNLPNLTILDVQYCQITDETINSIVNNCKKITKILCGGCSKIDKTKLSQDIKHILEGINY